ncbi:MAG: Hpt domain-containing protein [Pseudomonadota bacterium]|nr:Hpt domain-containing protein [Pseudomonadota bacterium]
MNARFTQFSFPGLSLRGLGALVALLGLSFVAAVLVPGLEVATELEDSSIALQVVGEQQRDLALLRAALESSHDRLQSRGYIGDSLIELRTAAGKLDVALDNLVAARPVGWFARIVGGAAVAEPIAGQHATLLRSLWATERTALDPLMGFKGVPYQDNELTGTGLNENGRQFERDVNAAVRTTRHTLPLLDGELTAMGVRLQSANARSAAQLRLVMLAGLVISGVLIVLVTMLLSTRRRQERTLREARQQTEDILRTVKEGLFLLDQQLVIGSAYSAALETMFQRKGLAGMAFEDLLKDIVTARTLETAVKFISILWAERTNEKLVTSINPLGEVEVHVDNGRGGIDTRYLEFAFNRVRVDGKITHVLVSVSDITDRVDLARELSDSQSQGQAQIDSLLSILHVDPLQLASFLTDSNASMKMINSVLREPAREEAAFRKKLDTLFRQAHSVKGEAAALGLSSIETRAHSFEEDLKALREKPGLSGNDFLPLVMKLDDLLTHLQSLSDVVSRLSRLHATPTDVQHAATTVISESAHTPVPSNPGLVSALRQLTERVAAGHNKGVTLHCVGFDTIPEEYRRIVKDIAIQAVRNAIVHGIEPAAARIAAGKSPLGTVRLEFQDRGPEGYKLSVEDDGQGLSPDRIKEVALKKAMITPEQAATLDAKQTFALLFLPGFSTVESATKDAGRGVGMNLIADIVYRGGGQVKVATALGKFTRLSMTLPSPSQSADATEAA